MLDLLKRVAGKREARPLTRARLSFTRFRKLLENTRAALNLVEDGSEKLSGDYIFDNHYVAALADAVKEQAGRMVYDAVVLAPEGGQDLWEARDDFAAAIPKGPFSDPAGVREPEYAFLAEVVRWMSEGESSIPGIMAKIYDHVIPKLAPEEFLALAENAGRGGIALIDLWPKAAADPAKPAAPSPVRSRPLSLMLMEGGGGAAREALEASWLALTEPESLDLRGRGLPAGIVAAATLGGSMDTDFIFVFVPHGAVSADLFPPGFHRQKTGLGVMGWIYDAAHKDLEAALAHLGKRVLPT